MLLIYAIPASLYCAKLRIALRHKGLEWKEQPPPGGYGSAEFKRTVPSGNLPALQDGPLQIADSEAIAEYLEETYPQPAMLPADPVARAKVRERSRFHDTRLEPELRALFAYLPGRKQFAQTLAATPDAGDVLTLGDCGYPITFAWLDELLPRLGMEISWPVKVVDYRRRVEALEAVSKELAQYRPRLVALLEG
jgi:glutathione S-transferase/maleylpyruvate isomerase